MFDIIVSSSLNYPNFSDSCPFGQFSIAIKERNMSEYIDFITYQDDAIIQRPLRYYRRRGQPHPQPKGDLHQGNRHH